MFSRRHLRIRVMQALYVWHQSEDKNMKASIDNLFKGTSRSYDLYLSLLLLLTELCEEEERYYADLPPRHTAADFENKSKMYNNCFLAFLKQNDSFQNLLKKRKIHGLKDPDILKKVFFQLRQKEEYRTYISAENHTESEDIEFCAFIYKDVMIASEPLMNALEEQNIWWAEALELINSMFLKTIKVSHPGKKGKFELMAEFRDEDDDRQFMEELFRETIRNDAEYEQLIAEKTQNWEVDRIALIDVILLKMALSEILNFPGIPVKVSINEYIDISKDYSTPKSKVFINGVIDKLVGDLKNAGKIYKTGRGLLE